MAERMAYREKARREKQEERERRRAAAAERAARWRDPEFRRAYARDVARRRWKRDPESMREQVRRWRAAHPGREAELRRIWYAANRERIRLQRRAREAADPIGTAERRRKAAARRKERNPEAWRAKCRRHRIRRELRRRGVTIFAVTCAAERQRWSVFGGRCWMCGRAAEVMDHVKPLAAGGAHMPCNLRPACSKCNSAKGGRWPIETRLHHQQRKGDETGCRREWC
jgi:5-methylcytosine-specific restriction endonuclease McrA